MPNPPFKHASDDTVRFWNQTLADYPCENWSAAELAEFNQTLAGCSESIRPQLTQA